MFLRERATYRRCNAPAPFSGGRGRGSGVGATGCEGSLPLNDWPRLLTFPDGVITISPLSACSLGLAPGSLGLSAIAWPANDTALFIPFRISSPFLIASIFWRNATTSGNVDAGVYDAAGTKLLSTGSIAGSGAMQVVDVTDTLIGPGLFYIAFASSTTGASFRSVANFTANELKVLGCAQQATALPLPATATFATITAVAVPEVGICVRAAP